MKKKSNFIDKYKDIVGFIANICTIIGLIVSSALITITCIDIRNYIAQQNITYNVQVENQYVDDTKIQVDFNNSSEYPITDSKFGSQEEIALLRQAKELYEQGDYEGAFSIYSSNELKENDYATINRAYFFAHGYGVKADVNTALNLYDSVDLDASKRNKLALLISCNDGGTYDSEILELVKYFIDIEDYNVMNYIALCKYGKNMDELSEDEKNCDIQLADLYTYEYEGECMYTLAYRAGYVDARKYVYSGAVMTDNIDGHKGIYYCYDIYKLRYLEWLEQIYG